MFQLTNRLIKELGSLDEAKGRRRTGLFVAEGGKCVGELLKAFHARYIFARSEWLAENEVQADETVEATPAMLRQLIRLQATPPVIAYFDIPEDTPVPGHKGLVVALDRIQDPGNMGTILRCCDWMGVDTVIASPDTVDCFNPKAVQAAMGALAHVKVYYTELCRYLDGFSGPVYGTFLDGENIYREPLSESGVIVMGNEGQGISAEVEKFVDRRLYIPPYPAGSTHVESLNVGMATAITLSQFRSRMKN